jgi:hypothetical protein
MARWRSWLVLWILVGVQSAATCTLVASFAYARERTPFGIDFLVLMTMLLLVSAAVVSFVIWQDRRR